MHHLSILAAGAIALVSTVPASAAPPEVERVVVQTADVDLATSNGLAELKRRVTTAARAICDFDRAHFDTDPSQIDQCMATVRGSVRHDVATLVAAAKASSTDSVALASR